MASIELHVSIYPTVWTVVMADAGLAGYEVVESIWATELAAQARAHVMTLKSGQKWIVASAAVNVGGE